jgi:uncharacterized protein YegJ (DUF2314 family)
MLNIIIISAVTVILINVIRELQKGSRGKKHVILVSVDNQEIDDARKEAQSHLDTLDRYLQREAFQTAIKVGFPSDKETEFCWLANVMKLENGHYSGILGNQPQNNIGYHQGERVEISPSGIVDWMVRGAGPVLGNFTLRALLKKMSKEDAKAAKDAMGWD